MNEQKKKQDVDGAKKNRAHFEPIKIDEERKSARKLFFSLVNFMKLTFHFELPHVYVYDEMNGGAKR